MRDQHVIGDWWWNSIVPMIIFCQYWLSASGEKHDNLIVESQIEIPKARLTK